MSTARKQHPRIANAPEAGVRASVRGAPAVVRAPRRARRTLRSSSHGFSLLEVMVAVAILGLVLTVILSAQAGIAASNRSAANIGTAITLARCKMTEREEHLLKMGYSEIDQVDTDERCCADIDAPGYACDVKVEKVVLPNPVTNNAAGDAGLDLGSGLSALSGGGDAGAGGLGALGGMLNNPGGGAGLNLSTDGGLQAIGAQVQEQFGGASGAQGMLQMAMSIVYPTLKPMLEASIRRISVTVRWKEGPNAKDFTLVQHVTNPQRGLPPAMNPDLLGGGGLGGAGGPGGAGGTGGAGMPGSPGGIGAPAGGIGGGAGGFGGLR